MTDIPCMSILLLICGTPSVKFYSLKIQQKLKPTEMKSLLDKAVKNII